eukprot:CAMPEP_0203814918 /NCGR_PEP_ID=MMETSP0115-20131106/6751_1 /ASSEMBLY_ACC=CAM_ASM_000227 /TAXON_ID=33651 /ORGANISM="Bicosoecid sp, Strain ms1" /LENGTH=289 /DNA_ID=CAMNT_0050723803 /DNA_START=81 /DNA_END=946 /DNA_ORIENTATION=+
MSQAMTALKHWVTAADEAEYATLPEGTVSLTVTHNHLKAQFWSLKFEMHQTIASVKDKCYKHTGTPAEHQALVLKSGGATVAVMEDDSRMLGFYSPASGMELHVVDRDPHSMARNGGLEDVSQVKKYEMSWEEYDKRKGTLRDYAREQRKKDPSFKFFPKPKEEGEPGADRPDVESKECVEHISVGSRCEVKPGSRRGEVAFIGQITTLSPGYWIGVRFDEPVGKGDGTRMGVSYFDCEPKYGAFVRPYNVEVGDFPPRDIFDELSDSDEDGEGGAAGGGDGAAGGAGG